MTNEITDKDFVISLRGGYKIYVNEAQMELIKKMLEKGKSFVFLESGLFNANDIIFILPAREVEKDDRIKKGEWQCQDCRRWHPRNEECGCQGGRY